MSDDLWIVIPNWERFQHYKNRNPTWIKVYTELSSDPDWDGLTLHQRGLLVTLWLEYARSRAQVSTTWVRKQVGRSYKVASLVSLSDAGFIQLSASRPLAIGYHVASPEEETEREEETEQELDQEQTNHPSVLNYEPPENGWMDASKNGQPLDLEHLDLLKDIP